MDTHPLNMTPGLQLDINEARQFLALLDPCASTFTWQLFDDVRNADGKPRKRAGLARTWTSTLDAAWPEFVRLQVEGAGVYVTVNETDGRGRRRENIKRVRAVWHDDDGPGFNLLPGDDASPLPHIAVQTSPGRMQRIWLTEDMTPEQHAEAQRAMVARGSDPNAVDISRVLRLPGTLHQKGTPHLVRLVPEAMLHAAWGIGPRTPQEIARAYPAPVSPDKPERITAPVVTSQSTEAFKALAHIPPTEDRDMWLRVGQSLQELGDRGFELWCTWAQGCEEKYDAEDQRRVWDSFKDKPNGLTLATLFYDAAKHGYSKPGTSDAEIEAGFGPVEVVGEPPKLTPLEQLKAASVALDKGLEDAAALPRRDYLVEGFLQRRKVTVLAAPAGVGKSTASLACAVALAMGDGRALGFDVRGGPYRVLLLNAEDDVDETQRRAFAAYLAHGIDSEHLGGRITVLNPEMLASTCLVERQQNKTLGPSETLEALSQFIRDGGFDVVIIDPLRAIHSGNEVDNSDMSAVMVTLNRFVAELNIAGCVVHHTRKPDQRNKTSIAGDMNAISGAGAIISSVRIARTLVDMTAAEATALGIPGRERDFIRMDSAKGSYQKAGAPADWFEKLDMRIPNGENAPALRPTTFRDAAQTTERRKHVLAELAKDDSKKKALPTKVKNQHAPNRIIAERLGMDAAIVLDDILALERDGAIERRKDERDTERWYVAGTKPDVDSSPSTGDDSEAAGEQE